MVLSMMVGKARGKTGKGGEGIIIPSSGFRNGGVVGLLDLGVV